MSTREAENNSSTTSFFERTGEYLNVTDYLNQVLRLVVLEPVNNWFGGSLGDTDLQRLLKQIELAQRDGYLQVEWYAPESGHTARSIMTIAGGAIKSAVVRTTTAGRDLMGMTAVRTVLENTLPGQAVTGSFFFQSNPMPAILHSAPENNLNVRSGDLMCIETEVIQETIGADK